MELQNKERLLLLKLVKEQIRNGNSENDSKLKWWDGHKYVKPRKEYGLAKMTTLHELESKLKKK